MTSSFMEINVIIIWVNKIHQKIVMTVMNDFRLDICI